MKTTKLTFTLSAILLVVYNAIMFVFPFVKTDTFWVANIFTNISILIAMSVFAVELGKGNLKSKFYRLPLANLAWSGFVLTLIAGLLEIHYLLSAPIALTINIILLAFNLIGLLVADFGSQKIQQTNEKVQTNVLYIKDLQGEVERLQNVKLKSELKSLAETIMYSDPMSHSKLINIENKIAEKVEELKQLIENTELAKPLIAEIENLFAERNRLTRLYKNQAEPTQKQSNLSYSKILVVATSVVVIVGLAFAVNFAFIRPITAYNNAMALFNNKDYASAITAFETMGNYKDSQEKIKQSKYELANLLFDKGEFIKANNIYNELGDYQDSNKKRTQIAYALSNGEVVYFGMYDNKVISWLPLKTEENKVLLICQSEIGEQAYNTELANVSWENSSIRKWLNNDFFKGFSKEDLAKIIDNNTDNKVMDKAFLLSAEEFSEYSNYGLKIKYWWLRDKAEDPTKAMFININNGGIMTDGDLVTRLRSVRPCIWISL